MKHIKSYKIFESVSPNFPTTKEEVIEVCKKYRIYSYTINDDLSIDVDGSIGLYNKNLEHLPLKFNYVDGSFECQGNKLKSLEGCPKTVGGGFYCLDNELKTLEGCPQTVGGDFYCGHNKLKTLEDSPQTVDGNFYCGDNELTDLEHFPEVNGIIDIEENKVNLLVYTFIKNADSFMIEDFNDYEIVRNRDTVMLDRLKTFIEGFDLEMPDLEEIKKEYKIIV
jgi:hypothetical protein